MRFQTLRTASDLIPPSLDSPPFSDPPSRYERYAYRRRRHAVKAALFGELQPSATTVGIIFNSSVPNWRTSVSLVCWLTLRMLAAAGPAAVVCLCVRG